MRILMVEPGAAFSVADVHAGWLEAFNGLGVETANFNLGPRLDFYSAAGELDAAGEFRRLLDDEGAVRLAAKGIEAACFEMWPDVLVVTSCIYIPADLLDVIRSRGIRIVILHTEQPYETGRELALAAHVDLNVLNDPTNLDAFRAVAPAVFIPHAYRATIHRPGPPVDRMASDFVFVGTGFPSRIAFFEQVDWTGIDVALAGMWRWLPPESRLRKFVGHDIAMCMDNAETADAYRSSKIGANLYRQEADRPDPGGWAMGPREVEMAACGLFFLRQPRGEGDEILPMLPRFTDPGEFGDLIRFHLGRPDLRRQLADEARCAIADRTFESNARELLRILT